MHTVFASLLAHIRSGEKGAIELSFREPCEYWISHATLGEGSKNHALQDVKYSIPNLPEGEYQLHVVCESGKTEMRKVTLHPEKPVLAASYEWQEVPHGFAVPAGLEIKMDLAQGHLTRVRIPEEWTFFGKKLHRNTTIDEIVKLLGQKLLLDGIEVPGSMTVEDVDLFNRRHHVHLGDAPDDL